MNKQSPEFKIEVANIFKRSKNYIADEIMELPDGSGKSRIRRTVIGLSQGIINHTNSLALSVYDVLFRSIRDVDPRTAQRFWRSFGEYRTN